MGSSNSEDVWANGLSDEEVGSEYALSTDSIEQFSVIGAEIGLDGKVDGIEVMCSDSDVVSRSKAGVVKTVIHNFDLTVVENSDGAFDKAVVCVQDKCDDISAVPEPNNIGNMILDEDGSEFAVEKGESMGLFDDAIEHAKEGLMLEVVQSLS